MSIKIGHYVVIPLEPGYIEDYDFWIMDTDTGEAMGATLKQLVKAIESFWSEQF